MEKSPRGAEVWGKRKASGARACRALMIASLLTAVSVAALAARYHTILQPARTAAGFHLPAIWFLGAEDSIVGAAGEESEGGRPDQGEEGPIHEHTLSPPVSEPSNDRTEKEKAPPPPPKSIIEVAEADECKVPREPSVCRLGPSDRMHIVFVSAMWDREPNTQTETTSMIKSIISQTRCKLWIHFLVAGLPETDAIPRMMNSFGAWPIVANPAPFTLSSPPPADYRGYVNASIQEGPALLYSLHEIPTEWVLDRAKALQLFPLEHHAGVPGMCKFFMADILWQVQQGLYLDVDMLLGGDIQDLSEYFDEMEKDERMLFWMGNNHPEGYNRRRFLRPYCSAQLVLHFDRIRRVNMTALLVEALDGRAPKSLAEYVEDGDQWLFMWLCKQLGNICKILPRMWNVSGCTKPVPFLGLGGRGKEANGSCWRIVHFNCMGHVKRRTGAYPIPAEWADSVQWAQSLKWYQLRQPRDKGSWKKSGRMAIVVAV